MKIIRQGVLFFCMMMAFTGSAQQKHSFEIRDGHFWYDSKPIVIHSGEMHYARIPREYWRHRLRMLKAMGLNTVATYVFWNYHNPQPGVWDFKTDNRNVAEFIRIAGEEGLFVILRPGPYACAEWEFGGYPWWLQKNKDLVIRSFNQPFLDSCKVFIGKLADQVKGLLITQGGPVIMVQVENEFGSYVSQRKDIPIGEHRKYNQAIYGILKDAGFNVPFFTSDGSWLFEGGSLPGVLPAANGENNIDNLKKVVDKYHGGSGPYMVAEYYPGWLDHWGEPFNKLSAAEVASQVAKYLDNGISFNLYMAHGGTNFGFTSGANYSEKHPIQPDITSYDYDAPVSEAGWPTEKYMSIRRLLTKYSQEVIPEIPSKMPVVRIPAISLGHPLNIFSVKKRQQPVLSDHPLTFEDLNQGHGYVLYSRHFTQPANGRLEMNGLRDYATVYVNGKRVGELNRMENKFTLDIDIPFNGILDILVENMGRINYGEQITKNTKGIISDVLMNGNAISGGWQMYKLPFDHQPEKKRWSATGEKGAPSLYFGSFTMARVGDVFLDMRTWQKGIVFVNGHHLGRYWNIGPQQTLYLPGCWLKKGKNEVVVFEQLNDREHLHLISTDRPILENLK